MNQNADTGNLQDAEVISPEVEESTLASGSGSRTPAAGEPEPSRADRKKSAKKAAKEAAERKKKNAKLKKEYLKKQKTVPQSAKPLICPPDKAGRSLKVIIAGYACRALLIAVAVFAVTFFLTDAFGLAEESTGAFKPRFIFGWSLLFTAIFSLSAILTPKKIFIPAGAAAAAGLVLLRIWPNPVYNIVNGFKAAVNAALDHLSNVGYFSMYEKKFPVEWSAEERTALIRTAVFLLIFLLSLLYTACIIRRIRIVQLLAAGTVSAGILWLVFTYNISRSNWGVVTVIASFSALLVLFAYDTMYIRRIGSDRSDTDASKAAFGTGPVPEKPATILNKELAAAKKADETEARKAKKKAEKKLSAANRAKKKTKTVDEELSDYFSEKPRKADGKKEKKSENAGVKPPKAKLTPAEKAEARKEKKRAREEKRKEKRAVAEYRRYFRRVTDARCAAGGFAGAGMFVLAMIMLFLPALITHDSFKTFKAVDKKFEYVREYVTAILMGDDPVLDLLSYENNAGNFADRPTEPHAIYYTGKAVMHVESNLRYNVYLRGWIGTNYNDETGSWQTASPESDVLKEYRSLFGSNGKYVVDPSESMMYSFYSLADPSLIPDASERDYTKQSASHTAEGFVVAQINMKRLELSSKLLYMPSFYIRSFNILTLTKAGKYTYFMRDYGGTDAGNITYANFFDGIYTSYRASKDKKGYAAVAMVPTMKISGFYRSMTSEIVEWNELRFPLTNEEGPEEGVFSEFPVPTYTVRLYDGSEYTWYEEYRYEEPVYSEAEIDPVTGEVSEPVRTGTVMHRSSYTVDESGFRWTGENDGNRYIVLLRDDGKAVYTVKPDGTVRKTVEDVPESMKYDEDGLEKVYIAPDFPLVIRYYTMMDESQKAEVANYLRIVDYYTPFVYSVYAKPSSSGIIRDLTQKIISEATETAYEEYEETDPETGETYLLQRPVTVSADLSNAAGKNGYQRIFDKDGNSTYVFDTPVTDVEVYRQRHKLVMEIVDYLCDEDNFTYALVPKLSQDESLIGVEKFLADTHEGSCVQFATSLVLMLREAGIPARFVEGYIASNFNISYSDDKVASYSSTVRDSNAHAWVEVWYDNIGWVQYEATPVYYGSMYEQVSTTSPGHSGTTDTDETEEPDDSDSLLTEEELAELIRQIEGEKRRAMIRKIIIVSIIVFLVLALIAAVFFIMLARAKKAQAKRNALLDRFAAAGGDGGDETAVPTGEEVRTLHSLTSLLLSECGLAPKTGEFRDEYAERIAESRAGALAKALKEEKLSEVQEVRMAMREREVSQMLDGYAAEEFGYGADTESMPLMARFFRRIYAADYRRHADPFRRIWLWFFKAEL
ncbi:MAG: hypothetical protein ILP01_01580 [Clostridia bacterium]|nr:hypothetical protein [Clostridia bacterium]